MLEGIIRTKRKGCFKEYKNRAWGSYFAPCEDPLADVAELNKGQYDAFAVQENFPKLPAELWTAIVALYFHYAEGTVGNLEAQVLLLRDEATLQEWKVVVPRQKVTGAHVTSPNFNECIDIISGEEYTSFPPQGWVHGGSSHSHNTMKMSNFSATDDANELTVPGAHILVSTIDLKNRTYVITTSIVMKKTRFIVDNDLLIDSTWDNDVTYHPKVLTYITKELFVYNTNSFWPGTIGKGKTKGKKEGVGANQQWYNSYGYDGLEVEEYGDPFGYSTTSSTTAGANKKEDDLELCHAAFDNEVEGLLTMGISPKDLIKRIYKIDDQQYDALNGFGGGV